MKILKYLTIAFMLFSCNSQYDRGDLKSFESLTKHFILERQFDSVMSLTKDYKNNLNDEINKMIIKANMQSLIKLLNSDKLKILDYNYKSDTDKLASVYGLKSLNMFIEGDDQIFNLRGNMVKGQNGEYHYEELRCDNLTRQCLEYRRQVYLPNIKFDKAYWTTSRNAKYFEKFNLKGQNYTFHPIEELHFRLRLKQTNGSEFFSKTIIIRETILPHDTFDFKIHELDDYYAGITLNDKSFSFTTELLEVKPIPIHESCELLDKIGINL